MGLAAADSCGSVVTWDSVLEEDLVLDGGLGPGHSGATPIEYTPVHRVVGLQL